MQASGPIAHCPLRIADLTRTRTVTIRAATVRERVGGEVLRSSGADAAEMRCLTKGSKHCLIASVPRDRDDSAVAFARTHAPIVLKTETILRNSSAALLIWGLIWCVMHWLEMWRWNRRSRARSVLPLQGKPDFVVAEPRVALAFASLPWAKLLLPFRPTSRFFVSRLATLPPVLVACWLREPAPLRSRLGFTPPARPARTTASRSARGA